MSFTDETRCGVVALVGQPNVGKSTLLNALIGQPLAIVSHRPQATRQPVQGILTAGTTQIIFMDQPGLLEPRYLLHTAMREAALESLAAADAVLHLAPANDPMVPLSSLLGDAAPPRVPTARVRTKADEGERGVNTDDLVVSAHTGRGLDVLRAWCTEHMPAGPFRFAEEDVSSQPVRFFVAEYVREAAFALLDEELPYAVAVEIDDFREGSDPLYIGATIHVERESQKRMVIGKGARMVRAIGTAARTRIEELLDCRVYLDLRVKVLAKWRSRPSSLARFGLPVTEKKKT